MGYDSFVYNVVLLIHILAVVVGFGSSFVWPVLAARARGLDPAEGYLLTSTSLGLSKGLTTIPIWVAGGAGLLLVILAQTDDFVVIEFSETWISAAFALFIVAALVAAFLHTPNLRKMDELQAKLVAGDVTPNPNGPPAEVLELQERGKQAGMYGGILHLLFLLLLIDMIWKPGAGPLG